MHGRGVLDGLVDPVGLDSIHGLTISTARKDLSAAPGLSAGEPLARTTSTLGGDKSCRSANRTSISRWVDAGPSATDRQSTPKGVR